MGLGPSQSLRAEPVKGAWQARLPCSSCWKGNSISVTPPTPVASFRFCWLSPLRGASAPGAFRLRRGPRGPDTLEGLAVAGERPVGAGVVFCVCIGSRLLACQRSPLISIIQLHTAAKIALGQMSWLQAPSFINSDSPSCCAHGGPLSSRGRLSGLCPGHRDRNLREGAEGRKCPKKNTGDGEGLQIRAFPPPDALGSASRVFSDSGSWRAGPGVKVTGKGTCERHL